MSAAAIELEGAARAGGTRLGALAGVAFALSFFLGVAILAIPDGASDRELVAWWSDSGNRATAVVSMYLFVCAGLSFLLFLAKLRSRLAAAESEPGEVSALVVASGTVFVAMLFVAAASRGAIGFASTSPVLDEPLPDADTLRYIPQIGYAITGTGGMLAAALTIAATSWLVLRTAVFGRWLAWLGGLAVAVILVAGAALAAAIAIPALLLWTLATSVALWRG